MIIKKNEKIFSGILFLGALIFFFQKNPNLGIFFDITYFLIYQKYVILKKMPLATWASGTLFVSYHCQQQSRHHLKYSLLFFVILVILPPFLSPPKLEIFLKLGNFEFSDCVKNRRFYPKYDFAKKIKGGKNGKIVKNDIEPSHGTHRYYCPKYIHQKRSGTTVASRILQQKPLSWGG